MARGMKKRAKKKDGKMMPKAKAKKDINSFEVLCEYTSEWDFNDWKEIKND